MSEANEKVISHEEVFNDKTSEQAKEIVRTKSDFLKVHLKKKSVDLAGQKLTHKLSVSMDEESKNKVAEKAAELGITASDLGRLAVTTLIDNDKLLEYLLPEKNNDLINTVNSLIEQGYSLPEIILNGIGHFNQYNGGSMRSNRMQILQAIVFLKNTDQHISKRRVSALLGIQLGTQAYTKILNTFDDVINEHNNNIDRRGIWQTRQIVDQSYREKSLESEKGSVSQLELEEQKIVDALHAQNVKDEFTPIDNESN